MAVITLRYGTRCAECGAWLEPGTKAKYYTVNGSPTIFGVDCHRNTAGAGTEDMILLERPPRRRKERSDVETGPK